MATRTVTQDSCSARRAQHRPRWAVPDRTRLECDWPYANRRYNSAGLDSYDYQARVLSHALAP